MAAMENVIEKISFKDKQVYLSELMEDESLTFIDAPTLQELNSKIESSKKWATGQFAAAAGCAIGLLILDHQGVESKAVIVPLMAIFGGAFGGLIKDIKQLVLVHGEIDFTYKAETINAAELARRVNKTSYRGSDLVL